MLIRIKEKEKGAKERGETILVADDTEFVSRSRDNFIWVKNPE